MSDAQTIGQQLVELCREGKHAEAIDALYGDNIVSVEAMGSEECPQTMNGIDQIRGKNQWWAENHEVHGSEVTGPYPHGDRFSVLMKIDVTPKVGPMAGNRMTMEEMCLYTVEAGKIVKEEFFYAMG